MKRVIIKATAKILRAFEKKLSSENNVQTEYINITERDIRQCLGKKYEMR
ncbi:MAG: hypothetical protein WBK46_08555 [Ruminococcus flavefaciens]